MSNLSLTKILSVAYKTGKTSAEESGKIYHASTSTRFALYFSAHCDASVTPSRGTIFGSSRMCKIESIHSKIGSCLRMPPHFLEMVYHLSLALCHLICRLSVSIDSLCHVSCSRRHLRSSSVSFFSFNEIAYVSEKLVVRVRKMSNKHG